MDASASRMAFVPSKTCAKSQEMSRQKKNGTDVYFVGESYSHNHRKEICLLPLNIRNLAFEDLIYHNQPICQFILGLQSEKLILCC